MKSIYYVTEDPQFIKNNEEQISKILGNHEVIPSEPVTRPNNPSYLNLWGKTIIEEEHYKVGQADVIVFDPNLEDKVGSAFILGMALGARKEIIHPELQSEVLNKFMIDTSNLWDQELYQLVEEDPQDKSQIKVSDDIWRTALYMHTKNVRNIVVDLDVRKLSIITALGYAFVSDGTIIMNSSKFNFIFNHIGEFNIKENGNN